MGSEVFIMMLDTCSYFDLLFQLQRNILATSPRVTRFKIDWDDTQTQTVENGENVPPVNSTGSESNQMAVEKALPDLKAQMAQDISSNACSMEVNDDVSISMS